MINLDLPWNPAVLEQRIGRIYRLGQKKPIDVYNLVSEQGIESRISVLVDSKQAFFKGLFDGETDTVHFGEASNFLSRIKKLIDPSAIAVVSARGGQAEAEPDRAEADADADIDIDDEVSDPIDELIDATDEAADSPPPERRPAQTAIAARRPSLPNIPHRRLPRPRPGLRPHWRSRPHPPRPTRLMCPGRTGARGRRRPSASAISSRSSRSGASRAGR